MNLPGTYSPGIPEPAFLVLAIAGAGLLAAPLARKQMLLSAGFEVFGIEGFTISAMYGGSLRCCTKVLDRSN